MAGVRTGDRGIGKHGEMKSTFEPGVDIRARVTILTDGVRGNLTKALVRRLGLDEGRSAQVYALGIKELWELPKDRRAGGHGHPHDGYPLRMEGIRRRVHLRVARRAGVGGFRERPRLSGSHVRPARDFQHFKRHPLVASLLRGGQMVRYGAKALPEGGWHTMPRVFGDGFLIAGDAGGFVNSMRLKGIHLAMRTGMLAAESAFEAIRAGDVSAASLQSYERRIAGSDVKTELFPVRNVHQSFNHGLLAGVRTRGCARLWRLVAP